jgi:hypothetical protein
MTSAVIVLVNVFAAGLAMRSMLGLLRARHRAKEGRPIYSDFLKLYGRVDNRKVREQFGSPGKDGHFTMAPSLLPPPNAWYWLTWLSHVLSLSCSALSSYLIVQRPTDLALPIIVGALPYVALIGWTVVHTTRILKAYVGEKP